MRGIVRALLKGSGHFNVEEAEDGVQALRILESTWDIDLVITDLNMPRLNGFELLRTIRRQQRWKNLPVLVITAEARKEDIVMASEQGAAGYIVKPFSVKTLQEKIALISRKQNLQT